jgi:hypothetical protein
MKQVCYHKLGQKLNVVFQVYYQGVLQQMHRHMGSIRDPTSKQRWQKVRLSSGCQRDLSIDEILFDSTLVI